MTSSFAIFGKVPVEADFVRKGDLRLVALLESWLAPAWEDLQLDAGPNWEEHYRIASLWWFALPHAGGSIVGVLSPSLDAVGRLFPIVVAHELPGDPTSVLKEAGAWLIAVELAILSALEPPGGDLEQLIMGAAAGMEAVEYEASIAYQQQALQQSILLKDAHGWSPLGYGPSVPPAPHWSIWQAGPGAQQAHERRLFDGWPSAQQLDQLLGAARGAAAIALPMPQSAAPAKLHIQRKPGLERATPIPLHAVAELCREPVSEDLLIFSDYQVLWLRPLATPSLTALTRALQRHLRIPPSAAQEPANYREIFAHCACAMTVTVTDTNLELAWSGPWQVQYKEGNEQVRWDTGPLNLGSGSIASRDLSCLEIAFTVATEKPRFGWLRGKTLGSSKRLVLDLMGSPHR